MKKNYWATDKNPLVEWVVTLPFPRNEKELYCLLGLYQSISLAGEKEEVYRIAAARGDFLATSEYTYADYLEKTLREKGVLLPCGLGGGVSTLDGLPLLRIEARLCYYDITGQLVEENVGNMGLLAERFHPEGSSRYMQQVSPVCMDGDQIKLLDIKEQNIRSKSIDLTISLDVDIWFSWVFGSFESYADENRPEIYDNRELANCHTPRFNNFLSTVRQLVLDFGGQWELEKVGGLYGSQVNEESILLDMTPI